MESRYSPPRMTCAEGTKGFHGPFRSLAGGSVLTMVRRACLCQLAALSGEKGAAVSGTIHLAPWPPAVVCSFGVFCEPIAEERLLSLALSRMVLYAVHALYYIGYVVTDRPVMAREISQCFSFSYDAALRVLRSLTKAGILSSHRGVTGGFTMRLTVDSLCLLDVVEAIEGRVAPVDPLPAGVGDRRLRRATTAAVGQAARSYSQELRAISVTALVNQGRRRGTVTKGQGRPC